ncbi:hypothetical protein OPQ81_005297 [Rhizoctonia solani]|nr:hypothetical protein OPQ81_005297 [Rhizoctonia solani]
MSSDPSSDNEIGQARLVPPQLPSILANVFKLRPIVGSPSPEEVKLVHEGLRALNNLSHSKCAPLFVNFTESLTYRYPSAPELRDTSLSTELSQYLFDIQMACHRQKYPVNVLPNDVVYTPPSPPNYISVQLKPITGFPLK